MPITNFCNGGDVNVIAAELRLTKMRPTSFYKKHKFFMYDDFACFSALQIMNENYYHDQLVKIKTWVKYLMDPYH